MGILLRGMKNVLRNPLRLILVVLLLGISLMFVATMVSLNSSARQQITSVHKEVGTTITINFRASNPAPPTSGQNASETPGQNGSSVTLGGGGNNAQTPIPTSTITKVINTVGNTARVEETLMRADRSGVLKTTLFQTPDGQSITLPTLITGISNAATHFTLGDGSLPTLVSGRGFRDSDANANVAMMNQTLATLNKLVVGSTFKLKGVTFTLIGLYTTSQPIDNALIVPIKTVQRMFAVDGVDTITAYAASYEQVEPLATKLRAALGSKYNVVTNDALYTSTFHALDIATNSIQLTFIVSIITAAAVIIFAVLILVRERTIEIGTLKAIGASHWQVIRQFWCELFALSVLAALLAALLLATVGPLISQAFDVAAPSTASIPTSGSTTVAAAAPANIGDVHLAAATLNAQTFLIIVGLAMALTILTSVIPAWYVAHIKPAVVLRSGN